MDIRGFQVWLSAARGLTRAQRREALAVLSGRSEGEASKAAIELGVDSALSALLFRAVRGVCGATSARAAAGPSTRYTPLSGLHHKNALIVLAGEGGDGEGLGGALRRAVTRLPLHRFLSDSEVLKGIVEADTCGRRKQMQRFANNQPIEFIRFLTGH